MIFIYSDFSKKWIDATNMWHKQNILSTGPCLFYVYVGY